MSTGSFNKLCRAIAITCAAALMSGGLAPPAYAVHDDNHFELGTTDPGDTNKTNIKGDGLNATGPDWDDLFTATGAKKKTQGDPLLDDFKEIFGGNGAVFLLDDSSAKGQTDTTVFAGSNKNNDVITSWQWDSGNAPAKDDVVNGYVFGKIVSGHLRIYAGLERLDESGDSHVDLEFNQFKVSLDKDPACGADNVPVGDGAPCEFKGERVAGDIIVSMDFVQGGGIGEVTLRVFNGTEFVIPAGGTLAGEGCNPNSGTPDVFCAFNNAGTIDGGPWPNFDKQGGVTNLLKNAFTEWGVDVNELLDLEEAPCFASVTLKTRTSQSFTSELKDFVVGSFEECRPTAATQIHSGNSVGATHDAADIQGGSLAVFQPLHDKAIVTGLAGLAAPTGTVTFQRYGTADCSGTSADETIGLEVTVPAVGQTPGVSAAESSTFTPTGGSALSYKAVYNPAAGSQYLTTTALCEPLTLNAVGVTLTTKVVKRVNNADVDVTNQAVSTTTSIKDEVTITANPDNDPEGTVTFLRYASASCGGDVVGSDTVTIDLNIHKVSDGVVTVQSPAFQTTTGFHSYVVTYTPAAGEPYLPAQSLVCEPFCALVPNPPAPDVLP